MFPSVSRLNQFIACAFVALWVPLTMHCDLEHIPGFSFVACCGESDPQPPPSGCADTLCATLEAATYRVETQAISLPEPELLELIVPTPTEPQVHKPLAGIVSGETLPVAPDILLSYLHVALPPRAPSSAS